MVTTKVIVFPVRGRRWAFAAQAATPVASSSSSSSSSVSQLWKRLLSVPKFTDRAQLLEQYVSTKMHDKWAELGAQPSESIRYRIYRSAVPCEWSQGELMTLGVQYRAEVALSPSII
ncbi:unnamed protein product [Sphagnum balticum]